MSDVVRHFRTALVMAVVLTALAVVARPASAQDTVLTGTVTDDSGAVAPGVSVTALLVETGNTYSATTDGAGVYRIGARPGVYKVTAELSGFATVTQDSLELLVGQRMVLNFRLKLSSVSETVTVTGESPIIDVSQSRVSGNIDTRQMESLPINGRNWQALTLLVPGSRTNAAGDSPYGNGAGAFQLNLDGQEVASATTYTAGIPQPKFSREAIGEFEMISSRFDATQGRSRGVMVNAISKSGTNQYSGSVYGYFRDDKFNETDFIANRVLPYSDQQAGATFGGPIRKDRMHFFGYYEGERNPNTITLSNALWAPIVPASFATTVTTNLAGARVDNQISNKTRLMVRWNFYRFYNPITANFGATIHPSRQSHRLDQSGQAFMSLTHVFERSVNEIKAGNTYAFRDGDKNIPAAAVGQIRLSGYTLGATEPGVNMHENKIQIRDDLTMNRGHHEIKAGGEFMLPMELVFFSSNFAGTLDATLLTPSASTLALFPVWNDAKTWNIAALSPSVRSFSQSFGSPNVHCADPGHPKDCRRKKPQYAGWIQDNWQATSQLTLNLGLRWDFALDGMGNDVEFLPFKPKTGQEWNKWGPRVGFAYALTPQTVVRGGFGKFWATVLDGYSQSTVGPLGKADITVLNDGRANFAIDPFNVAGGGHVPTYEELVSPASKLVRDIPGSAGLAIGNTSFSYQTSLGLQRQIGSATSVQADWVWMRSENERNLRNVNLTFNPATGINNPYTTVSTRPFQNYGLVMFDVPDGYSNLQSLNLGATKRFAQSWQASATYTLSYYKDFINTWGLFPGCQNVFTIPGSSDCTVPVTTAPDYTGVYGYGAASATNGGQSADQRHRAVLNGIWQLPYDLQVSGLYFYGSGTLFVTQYGTDVRNSGRGSAGTDTGRFRRDLTVMPRNGFRGKPLHRVDMRLQKGIRLPGRTRIDGQLEVFNLFNHRNYGTYTVIETSPAFGQPAQNTAVEYQPRMMQLGLRLSF